MATTRTEPPAGGDLLVIDGAPGAASAPWTSNVAHHTVANRIGAIVFGGPIGLGLGALLWAIARRNLAQAGG